MKRKILVIVVILAFCLISFSVHTSVIAQSKVKTVGINVNTPTQSQIIQFVKNHPLLSNSVVTYDIVPSTKKPFSAGKVTAKYLYDGLNSVNIVRYIAGIPSNIVLDDEYNEYAQAGAVINAANKKLEHTPQKPAGMDENLYDTGYTGTSQGNLVQGYSLISDTVISGYMDDGDPSNIAIVGHRRWVLNPCMQSTGFGFTPSKYSTMYVQDNANGFIEDKYSVTAWPAQNTPIEYFCSDYPFTLSLSDDFDTLSRNKVKIRMTRLSDGRVFNFNSQTSSKENSKEYFNVDNNRCGQPHCIIWRPDVTGYKNGDVFSVEISGITKGGANYPVSYNVSFFSLQNTPTAETSKTPQLSKLTLGLSKMNPKKDTLKVTVTTDRESLLYCKVYDKNSKKVATIANGSKLKNAGNWYVTWKGIDDNKSIVKPGTYRIEAYLGNSNGFSKALSQNIQIVSGSVPILSDVQLSTEYFNPLNEKLSVLFNTDSACKVYCNVYDTEDGTITCLANGSAVKNAGRWSLSWNGLDNSGNYVDPGQYRLEIYLMNENGTGGKVNVYVETYYE